MRLPGGERAQLGRKIEDYALDDSHRRGGHKARLFASILGITRANADILRRALLAAAATSDDAEASATGRFGQTYTLRVPIRTIKGSATVLTAWLIRLGEDFPRLTTCYIIRRR